MGKQNRHENDSWTGKICPTTTKIKHKGGSDFNGEGDEKTQDHQPLRQLELRYHMM